MKFYITGTRCLILLFFLNSNFLFATAPSSNSIISVMKGSSSQVLAVIHYLVSPSGTVFPIPKNASQKVPVFNNKGKNTGIAFRGGIDSVFQIRLMYPRLSIGSIPAYPCGYIVYENILNQHVNPYSGKTLSKKESHYCLK